jgi:predicted nucleic acid-binding protein
VTLALDTSALVARYLGGPTRAVIADAMAADGEWCASELALTEALVLIERVTDFEGERAALRAALHDDWERINVVPLDRRCLDRATDLGRAHPLRTIDALHLAAADRLPRPVTYATFDPRQIPVALALGYAVTST